MGAIDEFVSQQASTLLRPGEDLRGVAYLWRVPPWWLRLLGPLLQIGHRKHWLVAATSQRLVLFETGVSLFGAPRPENRGTSSIEYADLASVAPMPTAIIGHRAMRATLRAGLAHDFLIKQAIVDGLDGHTAFATGFVPWIESAVASGAFAPPAPTPRLAPLAPPPATGAWLLTNLGGGLLALVLLGMVAMLLSSMGDFLMVAPAALVPGIAGATSLYYGISLVRARGYHLRGEVAPPMPRPSSTGLAIPIALGLGVLCSCAFSTFVGDRFVEVATESEPRLPDEFYDQVPYGRMRDDPSVRASFVERYGSPSARILRNSGIGLCVSTTLGLLMAAGATTLLVRRRRLADAGSR